MACVGRGGAGIGAATVGGGRRTSGAAPGGSPVCPPPGAAGALGAGVGAGSTRSRSCIAGPAGGFGPAGGGGGVGGVFARSRSISRSRSCCCRDGPAGSFGAAGGGAAAGGGGGVGCAGGGGTCGGGAAGGGTGRGGGGGAGRGGGGGAGRAGGAAFGCSLGGCFGFPSGPSSSLACATTIGADCACDGAAANCMAVRAVVASSASRVFVMMIRVPREMLCKFLARSVNTPAINKQALGRIVAAFKRESGFISKVARSACAFVHDAFRRLFQIGFCMLLSVMLSFCSLAASCAHQHRVASGLAGLLIAARTHVGYAVTEPFVPRQMFDDDRAWPKALRRIAEEAG